MRFSTPQYRIFLPAVVLIGLLLCSCNMTKFVPEDKQLLYKVHINVDGTKDVSGSKLKHYLRQTPNTEVLGFWKLQLHLYNTAPLDTLTKYNKWATNNAHKVGEAPVIYDSEQTGQSIAQIQKAMHNEGFFKAQVDTTTTVKDRLVRLTYNVQAGPEYHIRNYVIDLEHPVLHDVAYNTRRHIIRSGMRYSTQALDDERDRITKRMRNRGYYFFDKEFLHYEADSTRNREIDIRLHLHDYLLAQPDSVRDEIFRQMRIARVCVHENMSEFDDQNIGWDTVPHTVEKAGFIFHWRGRKLLRESVIMQQCEIKPGDLYRERAVSNTYANLNGLGPIRYTDIRFDIVAKDSLECHIYISRNKMNSVSAEVGGTYSSDAWGISGKVSYANRNIFRGAEEFKLSGSAQYEWRQDGGRALEVRGEAGLTFPTHWRTNLMYSYQNRPDEYTRNIFNAGLYYTLHKQFSRWTHNFNVLDISYIYVPYISDRFQTEILARSSILKYSYQDHLIVGWSYSGSYSNKRTNSSEQSYVNFGYKVETAGNAMYGISRLFAVQPNAEGVYEVFKVPYSQYARADVNLSYNQLLATNHRLVFHAGVGVAVPYLNSMQVPFEKRFFSGGANSVRGWQARTLGPGGYRGSNTPTGYDLQVGDIRLDLNVEYRWRVWSIIELAAFVDAGNNWTIRDYEAQPNGVFLWNKFYQQIALAYGVGLRLDFNILLFRIDFGVKLYDPSRVEGTLAGTQWRTVRNGLCWRDDMTFHFAIGYPF
ncbi:MAG: BamA/TamA family outer membrane protein [Paludibacteraceae bacterium]|nr:BamA/TamA family outer membrane protein [Paludibacteraceae bacterium]